MDESGILSVNGRVSYMKGGGGGGKPYIPQNDSPPPPPPPFQEFS